MRKSLILGLIFFVLGIAIGFYASQRNCLIAFITSGYINFWTTIELLGGLIALIGIIITLMGLIRKE
ncbi:MAG: hypothetical protein ACUVQX_01575 [Candidatus Bathycorpusculaceae bacterium]